MNYRKLFVCKRKKTEYSTISEGKWQFLTTIFQLILPFVTNNQQIEI